MDKSQRNLNLSLISCFIIVLCEVNNLAVKINYNDKFIRMCEHIEIFYNTSIQQMITQYHLIGIALFFVL